MTSLQSRPRLSSGNKDRTVSEKDRDVRRTVRPCLFLIRPVFERFSHDYTADGTLPPDSHPPHQAATVSLRYISCRLERSRADGEHGAFRRTARFQSVVGGGTAYRERRGIYSVSACTQLTVQADTFRLAHLFDTATPKSISALPTYAMAVIGSLRKKALATTVVMGLR